MGPSAKARGVLESAAYLRVCEHLQKPRNAGSRLQTKFFNSLLNGSIGIESFDAENFMKMSG
jgi:hypothetical protein